MRLRMSSGLLIVLGLAALFVWSLGTQFGGGATAEVIPGRYIVQFKSDLVDDVDATVQEFEAEYDINVLGVYYYAIKGFWGEMSEETASVIAQDPRVQLVEPENIVAADEWGDANCDGRVNAVDALDILRFVVGLPFRDGVGCRSWEVGTTELP